MHKILNRESVVLVVPQNDAEAVLIIQIATALNIKTIVSAQPHGAKLKQEEHLFAELSDLEKKTVVIVEMPGPETEAALRGLGYELCIIDHHRYDDLDRMTDPETHDPLPSSLEQFLGLFQIKDQELKDQGFDPRLVRGVGAMDRGFLWAMQQDGFSESEIKAVSSYVRELSKLARGEDKIALNDKAVEEAWKTRKMVGDFLLFESDVEGADIRSGVSLLSAEEYGRPMPMIISSRSGLLLYVQETEKALDLFKAFGGFTFGQDRCWGYNNATGKRKVILEEIRELLHI